jgi:hypothetical protein
MARRRPKADRGPSDEPSTKSPRALADGAVSVFVEAQQQQGVPSGVHPAGADVLRSFHELQRLATARGETPGDEAPDTTKAPERTRPQVGGLAYPWTILDATEIQGN